MQTRVQTFLLFAALCLTVALRAQDRPQDKLLTAHSFQRQITAGASYLLFLPKGYEPHGDQHWPLILFLHGAGERGSNVWQVNVHGPAQYIPEHGDFPFIVVSPQCPAERSWSDEVLLALLTEITTNYKVDADRIYLTGLSMGGYETWSLSLASPEIFAAGAPICGGGEVLPIVLAKTGFTTPQRKEALKGLPIWAFHGGKDNVVPPLESERMVQALKELGSTEVKLTVYPEANHNAWTQTYSNPDFYKWLLEHKRQR